MPPPNQNQQLLSLVPDGNMYDVVVIGGGAAGFFCAINCAEKYPGLRILILEATKSPLNKVRISGGGRCNVTNACEDPELLVTNYPRGQKELLGPFHYFGSRQCLDWFESHGVPLKTEADGRIFPKSNSSQSILDCFYNLVLKFKIELRCNARVTEFCYDAGTTLWEIRSNQQSIHCKKLVVTTGSDSRIWDLLKQLGHDIIPAVPSLFTFNIRDKSLNDLMGLSVPNADVKIIGTRLASSGPLLITHWGLSGPAILKLSAWGARVLAEMNYTFELQINWFNLEKETLHLLMIDHKKKFPKKKINSQPLGDIPLRLWKYLYEKAKDSDPLLRSQPWNDNMSWSELNSKQWSFLENGLLNSIYRVNGKSTFKEEFVTAGGVDLKNINFKSFESKVCPNLYLAGEVLNIDALTGGFNFQAAWTAGYIIADKMNL